MRHLLFALAFLAAACGNTTVANAGADKDVAVQPDTVAASDAPKADAPKTDAAPTADAPAEDVQAADVPQCAVDAPSCATACGVDVYVEAVCTGTAWSCPAGSLDAATCPPDTCWGTPPPDMVCDKGSWVCKAGWLQFSPNAPCVEATCENLSAALAAGIEALTVNHQLCGKDEDCAVVPTSTACQGTCGTPLTKNLAGAFAAGLDALDQKLCKATDYATKCGYSTPKCMAPAPGCVSGKCVYNKANP